MPTGLCLFQSVIRPGAEQEQNWASLERATVFAIATELRRVMTQCAGPIPGFAVNFHVKEIPCER